MKLRNFLIVLFAVLIVFAFASCKQDPPIDDNKEQQTETESEIYQIQVTEGVDKDYWSRDKIKLIWTLSADERIEKGDVITLKYRSERDVYQWDIRDSSTIYWVYENQKNGFEDPVKDEDGWYTLTYTFGDGIQVNTSSGLKGSIDVPYPYSTFGIYFRGNFVTTDIFEIKDIKINGEELESTFKIDSKAVLTGTEDLPTVEYDWSKKNYAVLFATGQVGSVDKTPIAEKVPAGGFVTGAPISKEGYTLTIYTSADKDPSKIFDQTLPINEEKVFYYEYVGLPQTVKFVTNTDATIAEVKVPYGDKLNYCRIVDENGHYVLEEGGAQKWVNLLPEDPAAAEENKMFAAWCTDEGLTTDFNPSDEVKSDLTLYAKYAEKRTVTFHSNGGTDVEAKVVADGYKVDMPEAPTKTDRMFMGWFTEAELENEFNFNEPVTGDVDLYAKWVGSTTVTLMKEDGETVDRTFSAALDEPLDPENENLVVVDDRIGSVFVGWFDDAAGTIAHDYTPEVTEPIILYPKWEEATLYQLVALNNGSEPDKQYRYDKIAVVQADAKVSDGDVLSFRYRTTKMNTGFSLRKAPGGNKWIYQNTDAENNYGLTSFEIADDGWIYVTYIFDHTTAVDSSSITGEDENFELHFFNRYNEPAGNPGIEKGDILEIQDLAINGVECTITEADVSGYAGASLSIINGGEYAWTEHTASFVVGEGVDPIEDVKVPFNTAIVLPEDPEKDGCSFGGWFTDVNCEDEFNKETLITEDITLYAKWLDASVQWTVTFNLNYTDCPVAATETVNNGTAVDEPDDPVRDGYYFDCWTTDIAGENEYNFETLVEADLPLYAQWTQAVTLTVNLNYGDTPETKSFTVRKGKTPVVQIARDGYCLTKLTETAEVASVTYEVAALDADKTVYAQWELPTKYYKLTVSADDGTHIDSDGDNIYDVKKVQLRYKGSEGLKINPVKGDIITLMYKSSADITEFSLRDRRGNNRLAYYSDIDDYATEVGDGWYALRFVYDKEAGWKDSKGKALAYPLDGFLLAFHALFTAGDTVEIKAFAYNGKAIEISGSDTSKGVYEGCFPTLEYLDILSE